MIATATSFACEAESLRNTLTKKTNGREEAAAKKLISRPFEEETHMNFASVSSLWHSAAKLCANCLLWKSAATPLWERA
jgi:hypothetical protein